jgi:pyruvate formate lyase activating enzyme
MTDKARTPHATLLRARRIAQAAGLRHVYVGNVLDRDAGSTYCPGCGKMLIERDGYELGEYNLRGNECRFCRCVLPGHFSPAGAGRFGARRIPVAWR